MLLRETDYTFAHLSNATAAHLFILIAMLPVAGWLFDKIGVNRLLLASSAVLMIAQVVLLFLPNTEFFHPLGVITNAVSLAGLSVIFVYAFLSVIRTNQNLLLMICGVWLLSDIYGALLTWVAPLVTTVSQSIGIPGKSPVSQVFVPSLVLLAVLCTAAAYFLHRVATNRLILAYPSPGESEHSRSMFPKGYWWLIAVVFLSGMAIGGFNLVRPIMMLNEISSVEQRVWLRDALPGASLLGVLLVAWLCTRITDARLLTLCAVTVPISIVIFLVPVEAAWAVVLGSVLSVSFSSLLMLIAISIVGNTANHDRLGLTIGLLATLGLLGSFAGQKFISWGVDFGGLDSIETKFFLCVLALAGIVAAICSLHVSRRYPGKNLV